jgi:hypothetical protein
MIKSVATAVLLVSALCGCQTPTFENYRAQVDQWLDKPVDDLVLQWGPPQGTFKLGDGNTLMEYVRGRQEIRGGDDWPFAFHRHFPDSPIYSVNYVCKTRFIVTPERYVKSWSWEGNDCVAY